MSAVGDGRTARRAATRAKVLAAATEVFAERGFAATTMDEIAAAARVSKGTLFYHFAGKEALFSQTLSCSVSELRTAAEAATAGLGGWAALEALVAVVVEHVGEHPAAFQLIAMELFREGRPWAGDLRRVRGELIAPIAEVLLRVRAERQAARLPVGDPTEVESVAVALLGALCFSALDRRAFCPGRDAAAVRATLMAVVSGLRPG